MHKVLTYACRSCDYEENTPNPCVYRNDLIVLAKHVDFFSGLEFPALRKARLVQGKCRCHSGYRHGPDFGQSLSFELLNNNLKQMASSHGATSSVQNATTTSPSLPRAVFALRDSTEPVLIEQSCILPRSEQEDRDQNDALLRLRPVSDTRSLRYSTQANSPFSCNKSFQVCQCLVMAYTSPVPALIQGLCHRTPSLNGGSTTRDSKSKSLPMPWTNNFACQCTSQPSFEFSALQLHSIHLGHFCPTPFCRIRGIHERNADVAALLLSFWNLPVFAVG